MRKIVIVCLTAFACAHPTPRGERIAAASQLTARCAASRLAKWNLRAGAAGSDCSVLLLDASTVLDDSLVEAVHYGSGAYAVGEGGVRRFAREREFRGVVYRDRSGRRWTYGDAAGKDLQPCR